MKNIFRSLFFVFCMFTTTNPVHAQWIQTNVPDTMQINAFAVSPSGAGQTNLFAGTSGGVFVTTDNGIGWTAVDSGLTSTDVLSLAVYGANVFAGTLDGGVFLSANNGTSWTAVDSGLTSTDVVSLAVYGANLFAGTNDVGVFLSTNIGTSWTPVDSGLANSIILSLAVSGSDIFAGTYNGVFLSTNIGAIWTGVNSGLGNPSVVALSVNDGNIFAGTYNGVFLSTDGGTSWTASGLTESVVHALAVSGSDVFAGTGGAGVFLSTDNGTSWTAEDAGMTFNGYIVYALAVSDGNLFAGTHGGLWRRPLSEMITTVKNIRNDGPMRFSVSQNYPNPFNPTTVIKYQVAANSLVTLKVYDMLGREVATLVDGRQTAGYYNVNFDGSRLASGVYLYRLQAETYSETKNFMLLK